MRVTEWDPWLTAVIDENVLRVHTYELLSRCTLFKIPVLFI